MKLINKLKVAMLSMFILLACMPGALADSTSDMINSTTSSIEAMWPLIILFLIMSLIFGMLGGIMAKFKFNK